MSDSKEIKFIVNGHWTRVTANYITATGVKEYSTTIQLRGPSSKESVIKDVLEGISQALKVLEKEG